MNMSFWGHSCAHYKWLPCGWKIAESMRGLQEANGLLFLDLDANYVVISIYEIRPSIHLWRVVCVNLCAMLQEKLKLPLLRIYTHLLFWFMFPWNIIEKQIYQCLKTRGKEAVIRYITKCLGFSLEFVMETGKWKKYCVQCFIFLFSQQYLHTFDICMMTMSQALCLFVDSVCLI